MHRTTCLAQLDMSTTSTIQYYREVSHAYSDSHSDSNVMRVRAHLSTYGKLVTPRRTEQNSIRSCRSLVLEQIRGITLPKTATLVG